MSLNKFSQLPDELLDCILNMYWMDKYNIVLDELNNFINGGGKVIDELEKNESLDKNLLRYLTVKVKEFDLDTNYFSKKEFDEKSDKKESFKN